MDGIASGRQGTRRCSSSDPTASGADTGADTAADGEACIANGDCTSLAPADSATRITGTLLDFATGAPIPDLEVRVIGTLSALGDPGNATPVAKGISGANGKVDFVSAGR